jgi:BNR repeat-containing family member
MKLKVFTTFLLLFVSLSIFAQTKNLRLVQIAKGWAKTSINAVIFRKNSVTSFRKNQYVAFYDENSKVVIAKRKLGSTKWDIKTTQFSGNTADAHNAISLAVDGRGFLHLAWNHHNSPLQYTRSISAESVDFTEVIPMTGVDEKRVSYPEFYNFPNGNLLFEYRSGGSGNGNVVMNLYDAISQKWSRLQNNLVSGEGKRNAYPQTFVDKKGTIHVSWVWRESPDVATNHDLCYAKSTDGGKTWTKSNGEKYVLPITEKTAEIVRNIPQNSELINQTSMTADDSGKPFIASYWRDANSKIPQFRIVCFDGKIWNESQVSDRKMPFTLSGGGTKRIPISRPNIAVDGKKIIVIFRDAERGNKVSAATCSNIKKCVWKTEDLTDFSVEMWEPSFDQNLWNKTKMLNLFVQKVGQGDGEKSENLEPQMISILEWKP